MISKKNLQIIEIGSGNNRLDDEIVNLVHRFREAANTLDKRLPDISNIEEIITKGGYQREMKLTDDEAKDLGMLRRSEGGNKSRK